MKYIIVILCFLFCVSVVSAQRSPMSKPVIDSAAINHWSSLGLERAISNDGKYFMYSIDNQPVGSNTMIIRSTEGYWQRELVGIAAGVFSGDNKEFIYQDADTLFFLSLGKDGIRKITGVASYNEPSKGNGRWLVYQLNNESKELLIHDFATNQEKHFSHVKGYLFNDAMTTVLMKTDNGLEWAKLSDGKVSELWLQNDRPGSTLGGYAIDKTGTQVSFLTTVITDSTEVNTIWYYREGMGKAEVKVADGSKGINPGLKVAGDPPRFNGDGRFIYFTLTSSLPKSKPSPDAVSVDVWSWKDSVLQATQLAYHPNSAYSACISNKDERVVRLEYENEQNVTYDAQDDYVVIAKNNNPGDRFWLDKPDSFWLVSLKDGIRTLLDKKTNRNRYQQYYFSPDGRYLVYYDCSPQQGNFFSLDLTTKEVRKISSGLPNGWLSYKDDRTYLQGTQPDTTIVWGSCGLVGWEPSDTSLLVYGDYDVWKLSLTGIKQPLDITRGFGRMHHMKFRSAEQDGEDRIFQQGGSLLLAAFNTQDKYNGFYQISLFGKGNPMLLSMGPWTVLHISIALNEFDHADMVPMKAADAGSWVVLRMSATEAPNYFLTKDFKNYKPLTDLQPQKNYSWLTTELMSWVQPDGITNQGVLYKPEDFDPHKKYPVIIHYYEQMSHRLYEYPQPEYTGSAQINIPWFVSHGYLIFTPDIYYHKYARTQSACTTVESAGRMLAKLPYVDSLRMGIAGHSWGGAETNYIVTHTHQFAAALSGCAGVSGVDLIGISLEIKYNNNGDRPFNLLGRCEGEIGATLWQRPDLWVKYSPVFQADQVTTPFLIFSNKADDLWNRALELFIALRRLEKPTWMLQYDKGGHEVGGKDAEDFTIRATQFFDHYLKGAPEPVWMSKGIRAADKMVKNGLELDTSSVAP